MSVGGTSAFFLFWTLVALSYFEAFSCDKKTAGLLGFHLLFQDEKLKRLVEIHGERWDFIASHFADRADVQCQHRWQKVVNPELVKGPWTKEEDERVVELVGKYGPKR